MPHLPFLSRTAGCKFCGMLSALLMLATLLLAGSAASAQSSAQMIEQLEIGFEGSYRVGKWTPVWVQLVAGEHPLDGRLEITTPDGDGVPATYSALGDAVQLVAGQRQWQLVYAKFGRTRTWLTVRVRHQNGTVAERTFAAGSFPAPQPVAREAVLTLGGDLAIEEAIALSRRRGEDAYLACRQQRVERLPDHWFGYDSADTIVLIASNPQYLASWTDRQIKALTEWVSQGGRLIVSGGGELPPRWAAVYPGTYVETQVLRRSTTLEVYAGATQRLDLLGGGRFEMPVTVLSDYEGRPALVDQVAGQSRPIFQLAPRGFGTILFSAIDLSAAPLDQWRDRPRLILRLLRFGDESEAVAGEANRSGGRVSHIGYKDLSGQLRSALEAFSFGGISLIPFSWVAGLILLYNLLIGPVDYYFLRRVVGRMEYTWLTFPLLAVVLSAVAIGLTGFYKGSEVEVRQLSVLDVDLASGSRRQALWAHIYSPANARYDLATTGNDHRLLSWHGLPGNALGGMDNAATAAAEQTSYRLVASPVATPLTIEPEQVPINIWSTKSFFAYEWSTTAAGAEGEPNGQTGLPQSELRETYDRRLQGQLVNPTDLALTDCQLLYDRWAYSIHGTVKPGQRIYLADEGEPRDLEWKMTRRVVSEDNKPVSTPWNPRELEVQRIVEMMMFHRAAGGVGYTDLHHRQLQFLDLSRHLTMGRAVLMGKAQDPAAQLTLAGEAISPPDDAQWSYVRVIVPVQQQ